MELRDFEKKFNEAITTYNFVKELFPNINDFMHKCFVLNSQLKEGDSLEIKVMTFKDERRGTCYPYISANLHQKDKEPKNVAMFSYSATSYPVNMDLYHNFK